MTSSAVRRGQQDAAYVAREHRAQLARQRAAFKKLAKASKLSAMALYVLHWLLDFATFKPGQSVWMARAKVAAELHISLSTVDRAIDELEAGGWVAVLTVYPNQTLPSGKRSRVPCKVLRPRIQEVLALAQAANRDRQKDDLEVVTEIAEQAEIPEHREEPSDPLRNLKSIEDHTQGSGRESPAPCPAPPEAPAHDSVNDVPANDGVCAASITNEDTTELEGLVARWRLVEPDRHLDQHERRMLREQIAECGVELVALAIDGAAIDPWIKNQARDPFRGVFVRRRQVELFATRARAARKAADQERERREREEAREREERRKDAEFRAHVNGHGVRPSERLPASQPPQNGAAVPPADPLATLDKVFGGATWRGPASRAVPLAKEVPEHLRRAQNQAAAVWLHMVQAFGESSELARAAFVDYEAAKTAAERWRPPPVKTLGAAIAADFPLRGAG
jgi:hypothetical protein